MHRIVVRPQAEADIRDIAEYTAEEWGGTKAKQYLKLIYSQIDRAAKFPDIGSPVEELQIGYRKLSAQSHRIYYRIDGINLVVVRVLHERMDFERQLS